MSKKKQKDEEKREKPIFGSGAEPQPEPKDDGLVKCVCTVPCAWRGYHDEGDRVFVERKLLEGDAFFRSHFKPLEPLASQETDNAGGDKPASANGGSENANSTGENANGEGNGQGELGLK